MVAPYEYVRARHLPYLLHVPRDWLDAPDNEIAELIIQRLEAALEQAEDEPLGRASRTLSLKWALKGERSARTEPSRRDCQHASPPPGAGTRTAPRKVAPGSAE